ncbi:MAG TPA: tRNA (adenosine(37)-N6)-threonylcarbamoyltransferase complex transferase subunit TsaD [Gaiellaceae bacterium]
MADARRLLAIETSCDETAAAVVSEDLRVVSSVIRSQVATHAKFGGVMPELASREHAVHIVSVIDSALAQAEASPEGLEAIAVTQGPGLVGCLAVGIATAKALALAWGLPLVAVNHLEGHFHSVELESTTVEYPAVILLVSGGHTILAHAPRLGVYELLGATRDDSVGEAFDKVARELGLGYPGGPAVDRLAAEGRDVLGLPRPMREGMDFSFSGLKTAMRREIAAGAASKADLAASFAASCVDVLCEKLGKAVAAYDPKSVVVVGGVAASPILRARLQEQFGPSLILPSLKYATDNAAMIGAAGWTTYRARGATTGDLGPMPNLRFAA